MQRTDPEIARDAVQELESHVSIPADKIKVAVRMGVINNIEVKPRVTPAEIKARIEEALKRSAELDAGRISVQADGNTVRLHGSVRSWAEKDEAEQAAWSAPGITKVENYITVILIL